MEPSNPSDAARTPALAQGPLVLRFISGKYQGGEFPIDGSAPEIVIGRSSEVDMVLVEDMVSRRHARILVDGGRLLLEDLGSTNGTFVNGEKVRRAELHEGDRVLVGTSILKLVAVSGAGRGQESTDLAHVASARRTGVHTMSGSIDEIPLPDLMQLFNASKKSGVLVVRSGSRVGKIYFDGGQVFHASLEGAEEVGALKCLLRLVTWQDGTFEMLKPENVQVVERITMSTEGILMEGMCQLDELRRLGPDIPASDAVVALPRPLRPALSDLSAEELDVLQLALNHGRVEAIMNRSPSSDAQTSQVLVKLLQAGYLEVRA
jgi:pSer/pThr/pTyr-binding forkhead associated (FHA) protein